tara:strand:- start:2649 stop:2975 length:327 start_codon:yes stop_codon:yes gene_type:complete
MEWIKFSKQQPEQNKEVIVRFGNKKEKKGKKEGNWIVYPPKGMDAETIMSKEKEWCYFNKLLIKEIVVYIKSDHSENRSIWMSKSSTKNQITKNIDILFREWYFYDIL